MTALVFSHDLLRNWAAEVARIARRHPEWTPERVGVEVMAVLAAVEREERKS